MHEAVDRQKGDIQQEEGNLELVGLEDSHKAAHMFVEVHSRHVEELADQYVTSAALEVRTATAGCGPNLPSLLSISILLWLCIINQECAEHHDCKMILLIHQGIRRVRFVNLDLLQATG